MPRYAFQINHEGTVLSNYAQIVVDTEVSAERAPQLANVVRAWLVGEQIIEQEESDSVLSGTGPRARGRLDLGFVGGSSDRRRQRTRQLDPSGTYRGIILK